jgi:hypothetical protein
MAVLSFSGITRFMVRMTLSVSCRLVRSPPGRGVVGWSQDQTRDDPSQDVLEPDDEGVHVALSLPACSGHPRPERSPHAMA